MKNFDTFGIMIDCSRNAVYTVPALYRFIDVISGMGYNMLMLYTEDTYEIEGEPYFGYFRGRYTQKELKQIDAYAKTKGVELIPCIQTLAHLARIKDHDVYSGFFDVNDILLVGDERVYALIDKMFAACAEAFTSHRINIGMDEAHMMGLGRYLDKHGYTNRHEIMKAHLARVNEIAKKYGFSPMMWSDMYFRFATGGDYYTDDIVITKTERDMVPEGVSPIYWDYYTIKESRYDAMFENHKLLSDNTWFAGGVWTWTGFLPHTEGALKVTIPALAGCIKHGIRNVFLTMWGDNGGECSVFSALPALWYASRLAAGETDDAKIKAGFFDKFGISFDDFTKTELPDKIPFTMTNPFNCYNYMKNPSKYMTWNDPFFGRYDSTVKGGESAIYADYETRFGELSNNSEYGYLFRTSEKFCVFLKHKYELGARVRKAYKAGDKAALREILGDFDAASAALAELYEAYKAEWFCDKKPDGFEVQDIRFGGLSNRLKTCRARLADYLSGKLDRLEELDEDVLCCDGRGYDFIGNPGDFNNYRLAASQSEM